MDITAISKWLGGEWAVIAHAPLTFLASLVVTGILIWLCNGNSHRGWKMQGIPWRFETCNFRLTRTTLAELPVMKPGTGWTRLRSV